MQKAITNGFLKVILICLLVCTILFSWLIGKYIMKNTEQDMLYTLSLMDYSLNYNSDLQEQAEKINPNIMSDNTRITILDNKGNIVADTSKEIDFNENHLDRDEIKQTLIDGIGICVRFSQTENRNMLYAAHISENGNYILRLAIPYNGLTDFIKAIIPAVLISILFAFAAAYIIGVRLAKGIAKPLNEISKEVLKIQDENTTLNLKEYKYEEIDNIVKSIKILSKRIDSNIEKLKYEKNKINYILDNMNEGMILVDENMNVITINKTAMEILECKNRIVKNIVHFTQNINIINGVSEIMKNEKDCMFDIFDKKTEKTYLVHITKIKKGVLDKSTAGAIVLMIDVTSERESQKIRQNFFSDASHELKTPITSIQGYCELLLGDIEYSDEQKFEFLNRIRNSTLNITNLINDILMISRLEAGAENENISKININKIIDDIINTTELMRNENNISVNLDCEDIIINADYNKIYQLINNLIVNAIKYNKPNGSINIETKISNSFFCFNIKDTGIGIPLQEQNRVFERFYRVDKGRSRKMGGTGLGLAIVKHIVSFYKGTINLKSKLDKGTEIEVKMPLENLIK